MKETSSTPFPAPGDVLIARDRLLDPNFARSLVYIHAHDEQGALGLILNRPLGKTLGDIVTDAALPEFLRPLPLHFGGPVQNDQFLLALFTLDPGTHRFSCDINPEADEIREQVQSGHGILRAYIGYSGWGEGQLAGECARDDWVWTPSDAAMISSDSLRGLWELYHSGDTRWTALRDQFPREWGRN